MGKTTTNYHLTDGRYTGKTTTTTSNDCSKTVSNFMATGDGLSRAVFGPSWSRTSTIKVDSSGTSRTSTKKSWW